MTQAFRTQRSQADDLGDEISDETATIPDDSIVTRQEFKDETDVNILLQRFGVSQQLRTNPEFTETDYNLDLQQALAAIESARRANLQVPDELREKYPTWREVLNGAETGQYQADLQALSDKKSAEAAAAKVDAA